MINIILRKLWHVFGLIFPLANYLGWIDKKWVLIIVVAGALIAAVVDIVRFNHATAAQLFLRIFGPLLRPHEKETVNTSFPYFTGTFLVILLLPKATSLIALAYLAFGDTAAELVGKTFGRVRVLLTKTLEGTAACFVVCFLLGLPWLNWRLALAGAAAAALAELLSPSQSDNLTIPVVGGGAIYFLAYITHVRLP